MFKYNKWQIAVGLSGFMGIAMGAVGAHAVSDASLVALIERASYYQLIHTLAVAMLTIESGKLAHLARIVFAAGIVLFSGSLYLKGLGITARAPAAPLGGMLLMAGWLLIMFIGSKRIKCL